MKTEIIKTEQGYRIGKFLEDVYSISNDDEQGRRLSFYHAVYVPRERDIFYTKNVFLPSELMRRYDGMEISSVPIEVEVRRGLEYCGISSLEKLEAMKPSILYFLDKEGANLSFPQKVYQHLQRKKTR